MTNSNGKHFELLDFAKFARPNVLAINDMLTSLELKARLGKNAFMSYGPVWTHVEKAVSGRTSDELIRLLFSFHDQAWKNRNLQEAFSLIRDYFGARGRWYRQSSKPIHILGFSFKPSIKGVWFVDRRAYAVAINPRKGQPLSAEDIRFLARGIHELHCVDDPNDPIPLILDLSEPIEGEGRALRAYMIAPEEAISLESFEHSVREFLSAMNLAGISMPPPSDEVGVINLFRRR